MEENKGRAVAQALTLETRVLIMGGARRVSIYHRARDRILVWGACPAIYSGSFLHAPALNTEHFINDASNDDSAPTLDMDMVGPPPRTPASLPH